MSNVGAMARAMADAMVNAMAGANNTALPDAMVNAMVGFNLFGHNAWYQSFDAMVDALGWALGSLTRIKAPCSRPTNPPKCAPWGVP